VRAVKKNHPFLDPYKQVTLLQEDQHFHL
jgi:hypothetical protein